MKHDHNAHHRMMIRDFRKRFFISLVISIPIIILSPMIQGILGFSFSFTGSSYVLFALSTGIYFYGGWPFLSGFTGELKKRQPGMMTLIALAISVAFIYSSAVVFGFKGRFFFWELATLIDVMLLGHWIEMRSVLGASKALDTLASLMPDEAHLKTGEGTRDIKTSEIEKGNILLVKPGEKIPADGIIRTGSTSIDESMLTGESVPVEKAEDSQVVAGSVNGDGSIEVEVTKTGEDSYLNKVIDLVQRAQQSKSRTQHFADRAAMWLTIIALTAGVITLVSWLVVGKELVFAIERMATVMIITCPHALGLAIPLVAAVSTSLSAKNGLLIRNRTAFENSRFISAVVFDKTGTLTTGTFGVTGIHPLHESHDDAAVLQLAASLEQNSGHPIARGIVEEAKKRDLSITGPENFTAIKGKGVSGTLHEKKMLVVSPGYLDEHNIKIPEISPGVAATTVYLLEEDTPIGAISLSDTIREESYEAIRQLQDEGILCYMLTGDNESTAKAVSDELKLDGYFAEVLPDQKEKKIIEIQNQDEFVAMTGDGVNDAPALARADVGIAIGSGTDVAAETADIILVESNPMDVTTLILFGTATYKKMVQNLFWATGYNVFAIPLAAGVLYYQGIVISPALGAVLMSLSTVIVAINAKLLRIKR
ncbi:MAG TPA: copper-translocating P-type ATPase [Spirochaetota bacterium]|nr:copper-translocating P-type ATPase [Spirochaetota bacterium]